jgi:aspartyl protease family protein
MRIYSVITVIIIAVLPLILESCTGCGSDESYADNRQRQAIEPNRGRAFEASNRPKVDNTSGGRVVIKMKKVNGVYYIPVKINGTEMDFIFDTGAGLISISNLEASFLYKQGKITKDDILGKENFQDATGNISEGAIINLREVSIGGKTIYNVRALVTNNVNAPLLFGQTALGQFGQITIDYQNGEIIFQ